MNNLLTTLLSSAENIIVLLAMFLVSTAAFLYGVIVILPKRKGIFYRMLVAGLGCCVISNLSYLVTNWTGNSLMVDFEVGVFGEIGCFLFFLIANKSEYGDAIDDRRPEYAKYRKIAWAAPALLFVEFMAFVLAGFAGGSPVRLLVFGVVTFVIGFSGYYSLKYALIPGEKGSVPSCFRPLNIVLLIDAFFIIAERGMWYIWNNDAAVPAETVLQVTVYVVLIAAELAVLPLAERGARKLTTQF